MSATDAPGPAELLLGRLGNRCLTGSNVDEVVAGSTPVPVLASDAFSRLLATARQERTVGILAHAIRCGFLDVTDDQFLEAAIAHRDAMAVALVLEQHLGRLHEVFLAEGIDHVVLKGPAIARTAYPDPSLREYGDVDVLVPAEQLDRAVRVLIAGGHRRLSAEVAPGWDRTFAKSITMRGATGYELDLHRTIAPGVFGLRVDPTLLLARTQTYTSGRHRLRALSPEGQLLQACLHTAAGNRRVWLSSVCDIAQLSRSGRVDRDRFHTLAERCGAAAAIERAVEVTRQRLGGADVSALTDGLPVTEHDRNRLARYGDGFSGPALTGFSALPLRRWPRYARALLWPSPANLHDRSLSRATHLRRAVRHLSR